MSSLRRQACRALGLLIDAKCRLKEPTTVISAPPSDVADYTTCAIHPESWDTEWAQEDELGVDEEGLILPGSLDVPSAAATVASGVRLSQIGMIKGSGRIWVGSRLAPKREDTEDLIYELFSEDELTPGRLLVEMKNPRVGTHVLPWDWTAAFFIGNSRWTDEYAFAERLWTYVDFEVEIPIVALRTSPLMSSVFVGLNAQIGDTPHPNNLERDHAVVFNEPETKHYRIEPDGSLTPV